MRIVEIVLLGQHSVLQRTKSSEELAAEGLHSAIGSLHEADRCFLASLEEEAVVAVAAAVEEEDGDQPNEAVLTLRMTRMPMVHGRVHLRRHR